MKNNISFQIVYPPDETDSNDFHWLWKEEALTMKKYGITVSITPLKNSEFLMYRGGYDRVKECYQKDDRFINTLDNMRSYLHMSIYLPYIADLSIETFFSEELDENVLRKVINNGWQKAFIKKDTKALEHLEEGKSIWPNTSFDVMKNLYSEMKIEGKYAIRRYVERNIIEQEERYWVLNGNIYHRHHKIPKVVEEATKRLNKLGSKYYTIDATQDFIVEVNPGESSDRHAVNSAELFASWIKKEFVK